MVIWSFSVLFILFQVKSYWANLCPPPCPRSSINREDKLLFLTYFFHTPKKCIILHSVSHEGSSVTYFSIRSFGQSLTLYWLCFRDACAWCTESLLQYRIFTFIALVLQVCLGQLLCGKNEHSPCSNDVSTSSGTSCRLSNFERGAVVAVSRFPMLLLTLVGTVGNFVTGTTFRRGLLLTNRTPIGSLFQLVWGHYLFPIYTMHTVW